MFSRGVLRAGLIIGALLPVATAQASFHFMQIEQVIGGISGDTAAQAIQLRMRSGGQTQLSFARIRTWDAAGANPVLLINFTANVTNGLTGDRILIATPEFVAATNPMAVPNFMMTNRIPASYLPAGSLTFEDDSGIVYWRLSWGGAAYSGSTFGNTTNDDDPGTAAANFGPPFAEALPSTSLQAIRFTGAAGASSTTNAADYTLTIAAAVFTNNARNSFTVIPPPPIPGDIDGDRDVDVLDHARCTACLTGPADTTRPAACPIEDFLACDLDTNTHVDLADFAELSTLLTRP